MRQRLLAWLPLITCACVGTLAGLGVFTLDYAEATSYLSDDPSACNNCHVMNEQFDAWNRSSHREVAVCNDCHTPRGFAAKWATKARSGLAHSVAFTSGDFHEPIEIHPIDRDIAERACRECHGPITASIEFHSEAIDCIRCHRDVGHRH